MDPVVGIFADRARAEVAARRLHEAGFADKRVELLLPGAAERAEPEALVDTDDAEQPGVGRAIGGVVGGAVGASAGLGLAATAASLLIPGVGPVTAIGLAAAALFGAAGAAGGVAAAGALEEKSQHGLPHDEVYLYRDALMHGKGVVFAFPDDDDEERRAREVLDAAGAESLDAARHEWWVGIRDAERTHYEGAGGDFAAHEDHYRRGYLAALHPGRGGRSYDDALPDLRAAAGGVADHDAFRRGYERGREAASAPATMGRQPEVAARRT
jgi:hypothetical protein